MTEPKKKRGRPRKHPNRPRIKWGRFMCDYANPVAQVYVCLEHSSLNLPPLADESKDPTIYLQKGEYFIIRTLETEFGPVETTWPEDRAKAMSKEEARLIADNLFVATDEELRFGSLDGPNRHVLYRNRYYEVQFSQAMSYSRPFVIVDTRFHKVLVDKIGKPRRFYTLGGAVACANEEEGKLLP